LGERAHHFGLKIFNFNLAEIGCNADGAIQRNVERCG
jgi:hypothetical protein